MRETTLLRVEGLTKLYGKIAAVNNISFEVSRGEIFALIGPNGAGKSTTIKSICGLISPDNGCVYINGNRVDGMNCAQNIGYLPGELKFRPRMSTIEYLLLINDYKYNGQLTKEAERLIRVLRLDQYRNTFVTDLSYGNQRKLAIAASMLGMPELIILDEPTNGVDTEGIIRLKELVNGASKNGSTVLIASHVLDFLESICDRAIFLKDGLIVGDYDGNTNLEEIYKANYLN